MTKLLDQAVAKARTLPPDLQDEVARLVMMFAGDEQDAIPLTPEEEADSPRPMRKSLAVRSRRTSGCERSG